MYWHYLTLVIFVSVIDQLHFKPMYFVMFNTTQRWMCYWSTVLSSYLFSLFNFPTLYVLTVTNCTIKAVCSEVKKWTLYFICRAQTSDIFTILTPKRSPLYVLIISFSLTKVISNGYLRCYKLLNPVSINAKFSVTIQRLLDHLSQFEINGDKDRLFVAMIDVNIDIRYTLYATAGCPYSSCKLPTKVKYKTVKKNNWY